MDAVNLSDAKARFSELVERAAKGEEVTILKRGRAVARIVAAEQPAKPIDLESLRRLRADMPMSDVSGVEIIREMRDLRY